MGLIFLSSSVLNLHLESSRACVTVTGRHRATPTQTRSCLFPETAGRKIQMRGIWDLTDLDWRCEEVFSCCVSFPEAGSADGEMIEEATLAATVQGESQSPDEAGWGELDCLHHCCDLSCGFTLSQIQSHSAAIRNLPTFAHGNSGIHYEVSSHGPVSVQAKWISSAVSFHICFKWVESIIDSPFFPAKVSLFVQLLVHGEILSLWLSATNLIYHKSVVTSQSDIIFRQIFLYLQSLHFPSLFFLSPLVFTSNLFDLCEGKTSGKTDGNLKMWCQRHFSQTKVLVLVLLSYFRTFCCMWKFKCAY